MTKQQLDDFMGTEGYAKIPSNLPEFTIYFRPENNYVNVMNVITYRDGLYISPDQYDHIKEKIEVLFHEKGVANTHILSLVISSDTEKARQLCGEDSFCWLIDPVADRLIIYEGQTGDFYGMRDRLQYFLEGTDRDREAPVKKEDSPREKRYFPAVTVLLVCANVLIFLICTFTGDLLYNVGACSTQRIMQNGEYYRLFTGMFLHWDMHHLFGNMIILFYLGEVVEKRLGHIRYGVLYLISGLCGNLLSTGYELYMSRPTLSVGASGAVFGVIGGLLLLVIVHRGHLEQITLGRLAVMILYSLYSGFVGNNINNAAHIGGFLGGIAVAFLLWTTGKGTTGKRIAGKRTREKRTEENKNSQK